MINKNDFVKDKYKYYNGNLSLKKELDLQEVSQYIPIAISQSIKSDRANLYQQKLNKDQFFVFSK